MNSFYYAEEPLAWLPSARNIRCSDRGTLSNLLVSHNGYTLSTGVLSSEMSHGIASVPLDTDERMRVGYIMHRERRPSELLLHYLDDWAARYSDGSMRRSLSLWRRLPGRSVNNL